VNLFKYVLYNYLERYTQGTRHGGKGAGERGMREEEERRMREIINTYSEVYRERYIRYKKR